jgi:hypothetical protein
VSERKPLTPAQAMRAIQEEAAQDAIDEIAAMSPAEVGDALRAAGVEPEEASRRARSAIAAALAASDAPASSAAPTSPLASSSPPPAEAPRPPPDGPSKVISLDAARPRRGTPPWIVWTTVVAAAAVVALVFRARTDSDRVASPRPPPEQLAARARATGLVECDRQDYEACERDLDEARDLDPEGEDAPRIRDARAAIARWHASRELEAPKPPPPPPK